MAVTYQRTWEHTAQWGRSWTTSQSSYRSRYDCWSTDTAGGTSSNGGEEFGATSSTNVQTPSSTAGTMRFIQRNVGSDSRGSFDVRNTVEYRSTVAWVGSDGTTSMSTFTSQESTWGGGTGTASNSGTSTYSSPATRGAPSYTDQTTTTATLTAVGTGSRSVSSSWPQTVGTSVSTTYIDTTSTTATWTSSRATTVSSTTTTGSTTTVSVTGTWAETSSATVTSTRITTTTAGTTEGFNVSTFEVVEADPYANEVLTVITTAATNRSLGAVGFESAPLRPLSSIASTTSTLGWKDGEASASYLAATGPGLYIGRTYLNAPRVSTVGTVTGANWNGWMGGDYLEVSWTGQTYSVSWSAIVTSAFTAEMVGSSTTTVSLTTRAGLSFGTTTTSAYRDTVQTTAVAIYDTATSSLAGTWFSLGFFDAAVSVVTTASTLTLATSTTVGAVLNLATGTQATTLAATTTAALAVTTTSAVWFDVYRWSFDGSSSSVFGYGTTAGTTSTAETTTTSYDSATYTTTETYTDLTWLPTTVTTDSAVTEWTDWWGPETTDTPITSWTDWTETTTTWSWSWTWSDTTASTTNTDSTTTTASTTQADTFTATEGLTESHETESGGSWTEDVADTGRLFAYYTASNASLSFVRTGLPGIHLSVSTTWSGLAVSWSGDPGSTAISDWSPPIASAHPTVGGRPFVAVFTASRGRSGATRWSFSDGVLAFTFTSTTTEATTVGTQSSTTTRYQTAEATVSGEGTPGPAAWSPTFDGWKSTAESPRTRRVYGVYGRAGRTSSVLPPVEFRRVWDGEGNSTMESADSFSTRGVLDTVRLVAATVQQLYLYGAFNSTTRNDTRYDPSP